MKQKLSISVIITFFSLFIAQSSQGQKKINECLKITHYIVLLITKRRVMKIFTLGFCLGIIVALFPSPLTAQTQLQKISSGINQVKSLFGSHKKHATNTNSQQSTNTNSQQSSNTNSQQSTNTSLQLPNKNTINVSSSTSASNGLKPGDIAPNAVYIDADNLYPFNEGAAIVTKGDASALIDKTGKFIVPYHKYNFDLLQDGGGREGGIFLLSPDTGAVNSKGKLITKELPVAGFWAYVSIDDGNFISSIDQKGNLIYMDAEGNKYILKVVGNISLLGGEISENIVRVENNTIGKIGYKNLKDEWIVQPIYNFAQPFSDGLACVGKTNEFGEDEYGFINKKGEVVIPFIYSSRPENFHGGLAEVYAKNSTEFVDAFIDKQGKIVKKFTYPISSDYKRRYIGNGLTEYADFLIDSTGNFFTATEFLKNHGVLPDDSTNGLITLATDGIDPSNSQFNDNAGKIFFTRGFNNFGAMANEGYVDIKTKKIMEGAFQILNFSDTESKLSYTRFNTSRYTRDKAPVREGYINEDAFL